MYPPEIFERRLAYGEAQVQMCRHPDVRAAVHDVLFHCRSHLVAGQVEALALVLQAENGATLELFCLDVDLHADDVGGSYQDLNTCKGGAVVAVSWW